MRHPGRGKLGAVPTFAVIRERGPAWDAERGMRKQDGWDDHAAFMDALASDGLCSSAVRSATTGCCW